MTEVIPQRAVPNCQGITCVHCQDRGFFWVNLAPGFPKHKVECLDCRAQLTIPPQNLMYADR